MLNGLCLKIFDLIPSGISPFLLFIIQSLKESFLCPICHVVTS
ncbi:hypothetical protein Enr17x_47400 [Gimesia fumaroli]|uniref:Uncharacterized protein n=1 Tax=Gimesia fumaroli TaxID=2527976 RepID=A0A518IHV3_9PLAN|nr:hypothetical protein Enr17x_47400 [Gimesia fumaroli]